MCFLPNKRLGYSTRVLRVWWHLGLLEIWCVFQAHWGVAAQTGAMGPLRPLAEANVNLSRVSLLYTHPPELLCGFTGQLNIFMLLSKQQMTWKCISVRGGILKCSLMLHLLFVHSFSVSPENSRLTHFCAETCQSVSQCLLLTCCRWRVSFQFSNDFIGMTYVAAEILQHPL